MNWKKNKWQGLALSVILMAGCSRSYLPSEYVKIVEDQRTGLRKTASVDANLRVQVQLKPYDYVVCLEKKSNAISRSERNEVRSQLDGHLYFTISYSCGNGESVYDYLSRTYGAPKEQLSEYFERTIGNGFFLLTSDGDTLERQLCHYEYSYNVMPYERFDLVFESGNEDQWPLELRLHNPVSGEQNAISFNFPDYNNMPGIKTL